MRGHCIAVSDTVTVLTIPKSELHALPNLNRIALQEHLIFQALKSVLLFSKLSQERLQLIFKEMFNQSFLPGDCITREGEEGTCFYLILEGEVRFTRAAGRERNRSSRTRGQGQGQSGWVGADNDNSTALEVMRCTAMEYFGERSLVAKDIRKYNAVAVDAVTCLVLERYHFQAFLKSLEGDIKLLQERERLKEMEELEREVLLCNLDDLEIMRTVGTGTFGRVKLVQNRHTKLTYALKCMNKLDIFLSHQHENILAEKKILESCRSCPFIIQLIHTYNTRNQIFVLMEFVQGGELWSYIYEEAKLNLIPRSSRTDGFHMDAVKFYAANVILAFEYLHNKHIAYRDLKPENLLLDENGYLKVIDFGFAKVLPYVCDNKLVTKTLNPCGTPEYLAPEIVLMKGYDRSVDQWALGCFIYELIYKHTPFQDDDSNIAVVFDKIINQRDSLRFPPNSETVDSVSLIRGFLETNPVFRLGHTRDGYMAEVKAHPFFKDFDWKGLENRTLKSPYLPVIEGSLDCSNFDQYDEYDDIPEYDEEQDVFAEF